MTAKATPPDPWALEASEAPGAEKNEKQDTVAAEAEKKQQAHYASATAELRAMDAAFAALYQLPRDSRYRALRWLGDRLDNGFDNYRNDEVPF